MLSATTHEPTLPDASSRDPRDAQPRHLDVEVVGSAEEVSRARAWLDTAEQHAGVPLVDEAERLRLQAGPPAAWRAWLVRRGPQVVAYAALTPVASDKSAAAPDAPAGGPWPQAGGDVALEPSVAADPAASRAVLDRVRGVLARQATAGQVWVRQADAQLRAAADEVGLRVARRLGVLGRHLDVPDPAGHHRARIRAFRPGQDDAAVLAVLQAAYAGSADGGWRAEDLAQRQTWSWFRAEDLLLAELPDGDDDADDDADADADDRGAGRWVAGLHWLKRRSPRVGEVYNLAVHPEAAGRGIGPALLDAGLAHLRRVGCDEVVLWVDLANQRAVDLYRDRGFATRWEDIALAWP